MASSTPAEQPPQAAVTAPLAAEFKQAAGKVDWDEYNNKWQAIWGAGLQPGQLFDAGKPSPQLLHLIDSGKLPLQGKRAFVPGCGRGYDVVAFAEAGAAAAVGLEISETALAEAAAFRDGAAPPDVAARAAFVKGDFFTYEDPGGPFDVGYDYTFLCALHPTMREDWAATWARLLRPGGELVTMIYPVEPPGSPFREGPPWPVTGELYKGLLQAAGFESLHLQPIEGLSHERREGREWLGRWRRRSAGDGGDERGGAAKM